MAGYIMGGVLPADFQDEFFKKHNYYWDYNSKKWRKPKKDEQIEKQWFYPDFRYTFTRKRSI